VSTAARSSSGLGARSSMVIDVSLRSSSART
jgi:hypothetical protein